MSRYQQMMQNPTWANYEDLYGETREEHAPDEDYPEPDEDECRD